MLTNADVPITKDDFRGEALQSLIAQEYTYRPIPDSELQELLSSLVAGGELSKRGKEMFTNVREAILLRTPRSVYTASCLADARIKLGGLFKGPHSERFAYITGGLEGGWHHLLTVDALAPFGIDGVILGLETGEYTRSKGREPLLDMGTKIAFWQRMLPDNSVLFTIPPKPPFMSADDYYDWIAHVLGVYKNEQVVFVGSGDDPESVRQAHLRRAASPENVINITAGDPPFHTTNLLKN